MDIRKIIREAVQEASNNITFEELAKQIPSTEQINGENIHQTMTTKEIAEMLGIPVNKAYALLCSFGEERAAKFGYRTKDGTLDINDVGAPKAQSIMWQLYSPVETIMEGHDDIYFKTFSEAVQKAREKAEMAGYTIDEDDWFNQVSTGPGKPAKGETFTASIGVSFGGKRVNKTLNIQVYGMNNSFELNSYVA